jgi:hypothetical protein
MWFRCQGEGPVDPAPVRDRLRAFAWDGTVHEAVIGSDDLLRHCDSSLTEDAPYLPGQPVLMLTKAVEARFGAMSDYEVTDTGTDVVVASARFGTTDAQIGYVARRDDRGWADEASIFLAFRPATDALAAAG